jgi:energy-coupling factor transporter ATP-binding protein EcfA2
VYLVTGHSGSGKSTLARALQSSGHYAVSTDRDDYLCAWTDASGDPVTRPDQPSLDWLANCRWVWRRDRLDQIIAAAREHDPPSVWLCGWAANQVDFIDVFDAVYLLDIDEQTMLRRVGNESRGNDFVFALDVSDCARVGFGARAVSGLSSLLAERSVMEVLRVPRTRRRAGWRTGVGVRVLVQRRVRQRVQSNRWPEERPLGGPTMRRRSWPQPRRLRTVTSA